MRDQQAPVVSSEMALGDGTAAQIASTENVELNSQVVYFEVERLTESGARRSSVASPHGMAAGRASTSP